MVSHLFSASDDSTNTAMMTCVVDTEKLDESITEEEKLLLNNLINEQYKAEILIVSRSESNTTTLEALVMKANKLIDHIDKNSLSVSKTVFVQALAYDSSYLDAITKFSLNDSNVEFNQEFEKDYLKDGDESKATFYIENYVTSIQEYCSTASGGSPVARPYRITGWFPSYNQDGTGGYHDGIDFGIDVGTPVYATHQGQVVLTTRGCANNGSLSNNCGGMGDGGKAGIPGLGNFVIIKVEGLDVFIAYAHLTQPLVNIGDQVSLGQQIGLSGHSGKSTGPHLHFVVAESTNMYDVTNSRKVKNPCTYIEGLCE